MEAVADDGRQQELFSKVLFGFPKRKKRKKPPLRAVQQPEESCFRRSYFSVHDYRHSLLIEGIIKQRLWEKEAQGRKYFPAIGGLYEDGRENVLLFPCVKEYAENVYLFEFEKLEKNHEGVYRVYVCVHQLDMVRLLASRTFSEVFENQHINIAEATASRFCSELMISSDLYKKLREVA